MSETRTIDAGTNTSGILYVICASIAFSLNDVSIKWLSGDYPLHEITFIRASVGLILICLVAMWTGEGVKIARTGKLGMHLLRGLLVIVANMSFFAGLASIPIGEATAIFFVGPLFIVALSVVVLREKVGAFRWGAVVFGFLGVLLIINPGGAGTFQIAMLLPILAASMYALLHITTRLLGIKERAITMIFYIQLTFLLVSVAMGVLFGHGQFGGYGHPSVDFLLRAWIWPHPGDWGVLIAVGFFSTIGGFLISQGYRLCQPSAAAPFEYGSMVLAVIWGITIWNHWPEWHSWFGMAVIAASGLLVLHREARNRQSKNPARLSSLR